MPHRSFQELWMLRILRWVSQHSPFGADRVSRLGRSASRCNRHVNVRVTVRDGSDGS